ncbi:hypothetical protein BKA70DRAFT_531808 [Coprinopsis sp. MPI-PUGE-AT-0042]|nr:hypothetical protein BKA70DRAFT_531808 [Coprinopsis sp. MPI-PUGE-AT-0042]
MIDSGLDPNAEHTLVITQGDGIPLRLDSLQYLIPAGGQRGEVVQPHAPDGMLTPLSGAIPDSPPSSPTPTPPRPTPSPSQTNNIPSPNPPPQTPNNASTNATFPSQSPPADESNSLTRSSSNAQEQSDPSPTNSNTLSEATPSGSRAVIITDSKGLVITKILPLDRVITTTDSTGGIVLRTEPAGDSSGGGEDDGNGSGKSALGTGTIIAVVLGIVVALAILGLALLLLLRRRRRKKALEGHHGSGSDISPFDLINGATEGVETGLRKTPAGGAQQEDVPAGDVVLDIRRESRRSTGIRSIFARSGRDMPPPAYSTGGGVVVPPSVR